MIDFTSFLEANQDPAIVTNSTGQILELNKNAGKLLECLVHDAIGKDLVEMIPALRKFYSLLSTETENIPELTGEYINSSGDTLELSLYPSIMQFQGNTYVWFTIRRKTDKKKGVKPGKGKHFYKTILKKSGDLILRLDSVGKITYVSPSSYEILGYKPEEIREKADFRELIYRNDRNRYDEIQKSSLRKKDEFLTSRFRIIKKDGSFIWTEIFMKGDYDADGLPAGAIYNIRNITDRIDYQLELEKIRERYQLAVEAGHNGIWDYSFREESLYVDGSLKSLLGYDPDENIDENFFWKQLVSADDSGSLKEALGRYIREKKSYFEETFKMIHKRRVDMWVLGRGRIFYDKNGPVRIICSVTDITDKIQASELLRNALINFKAIFDAFPDLFFRLNKLGDFLEVMAGESADTQALNIKKYEGRNMKEVLPSETYEKVYKTLQRSFESRKVELCEYNQEDSGVLLHYEARIIAITDDEAICIVRDITDAVKTNKELIEARRTAEGALNAKDEFLSMMSHEIRTPMNVVIGMTYLLMQQAPTPEQLKLINTLKFSGDNLLRLINDLLDFSKIKAGKLVFENTDFNIREFVWNIYESYKLQLDGSRVELVLDIDEKVPTYVRGDYSRLAQILNNLLSNAQKFTDHGKISIALKYDGAEKGKENIKFEISDTGIGIQKDRVERIFEPFQQGETHISTRYGGTGLGLAIVKQLIDMMGGDIRVTSEKGKGTQFIILIPFAQIKGDKVSASGDVPEITSQETGNVKLLYAEDVASNQFLMKGYAELWKFELDVASNGEEAVDLFVKNDYDVVLLDLQMPVMDGFQAAKRIREIESLSNKNTPILAVTGDISENALLLITESGMNDYITKPINPKRMVEKIQESLRKGKHARVYLKQEKEKKRPGKSGIIDFGDVDYLYREVPLQYAKLMEMLVNEFQSYKQSLIKALREEDFDVFRQVRHSMRSNVQLLRMSRIEKLVDKIRDEFVNSTLPPGGGKYVEEVETCFGELIGSLQEKLSSLAS